MKVIVTAGGTGGHVYPALSIIEGVFKGDEVLFIGTTTRMEKDIVPQRNINYLGLDISGLNRKNPFKNILVLIKYIKSYFKAKKTIKEFKPDLVIGCGGYVTLPVIKAAQKLGIKTVIHEQNSVLGLTNKILAKRADKVLLSLDINDKKDNYYLVGNPRSDEVINAHPQDLRHLFKKDLPIVLIVMGSLGSSSINALLKPSDLSNKYNYLIVVGKNYEANDITYDNIHFETFIDNMPSVLKEVDVIISRAGATMLSEIIASLKPTIFIPSPYVSGDHQTKNAEFLSRNGGAYILKEVNFNMDDLNKLIDKAYNNREKIKEVLRDYQTKDVIKRIKELLKDEKKEKKD